jgi:DNA-directed RNA polymerase III subunit RPC3
MQDGFVINIVELFLEIKARHTQTMVRDRWGALAARLFRLLSSQSSAMEETQIAELCTAPKKKVREHLYAMMRAHLVHMQEIPKSADRQPSRTFFLWHAPFDRVHSVVTDLLFQGWANLRTRAEREREKVHGVLDKIDTAKPISEEEKNRLEAWKKSAERIEAAICKLNSLILLFVETPRPERSIQ